MRNNFDWSRTLISFPLSTSRFSLPPHKGFKAMKSKLSIWHLITAAEKKFPSKHSYEAVDADREQSQVQEFRQCSFRRSSRNSCVSAARPLPLSHAAAESAPDHGFHLHPGTAPDNSRNTMKDSVTFSVYRFTWWGHCWRQLIELEIWEKI